MSPPPLPRVLGLFAREPRPGHVKSRLAAEAGTEWAARAAAAFLGDLVERLAAVEARRVLAFTPDAAGPALAPLAGDRFLLRPQGLGDLGRRLGAFFAAQFRDGAGAVVVVGSDSPTLPAALVEQAFRELERADVVLGPAADGGYYLVGCARRLPPLFEGIAWGGPRVLLETVARLADPDWRLALLPPWYDVDTLDGWWALRGHLAALRRAALDPGAPRTEQLPDPPPRPA